MENKKIKTNKSAQISLCFGIASLFLWEFSIVPILAIVFGIIGLIRDEKKWIAGIGIVLGIIFIIVRFSQGYIDRGFFNVPSSDNNQQQKNIASTTSISNPDYLKNPSAYIVDSEDKIIGWSWKRQEGDLLWVEGIADSHTLIVSYVMSSAESDEKILKIESMVIPLIQDPSEDSFIADIPAYLWKTTSKGECWENGAKDFLQIYFLHTWIDLRATGWFLKSAFGKDYYMLYYNDGNTIRDLADFVIKNGYGGAIEFLPHEYSTWNEPSAKYIINLREIETVASLAKRGLWGTCQ